MQYPVCGRLCVIGLGLIGASFAQAIKDYNTNHPQKPLCQTIVGVDFNQDSVNAAVLAKVLHNGFTDVYQGITSADVILLAVPVKSVHAILQVIKHAMMSGDVNKECIITDVGSTKVNILEDVKQVF